MSNRTSNQQAASRANGAKSHGPTTDAGKARSSRNALQHGLNSATVVLPHEDRAAFESLRQSYFDRFQPADQFEADLVERLAATTWRLNRVTQMETTLLDNERVRRRDQFHELFSNTTAEDEQAYAFERCATESHGLQLLLRYEIQFNRQFDRTLKQLQALQNNRPQPAAPTPQPNLRNEPEPAPAPGPDPAPPPAPPDLATQQKPPIQCGILVHDSPQAAKGPSAALDVRQ